MSWNSDRAATIRNAGAVDFAEMAKAGVLMTSAVAVNGVIKIAGRIPDAEEISE
jgi:hypothetical protein